VLEKVTFFDIFSVLDLNPNEKRTLFLRLVLDFSQIFLIFLIPIYGS
jgi:hypothetical protein